jgi:hypothetical protein
VLQIFQFADHFPRCGLDGFNEINRWWRFDLGRLNSIIFVHPRGPHFNGLMRIL